jgi:hypothetical protein
VEVKKRGGRMVSRKEVRNTGIMREDERESRNRRKGGKEEKDERERANCIDQRSTFKI